jgi:hypothetical protein
MINLRPKAQTFQEPRAIFEEERGYLAIIGPCSSELDLHSGSCTTQVSALPFPALPIDTSNPQC